MAATVISCWFRRPQLNRQTRRHERSRLLAPALLEDRLAPATFTASINPALNNAGAVAELVGFVNKANVTNEPDTIVLWPNATYTFTAAADTGDGSSALPAIVQDGAGKNPITIQGNGATFFRDSANANLFRFFRVTGTNANLVVDEGPSLESGHPRRNEAGFRIRRRESDARAHEDLRWREEPRGSSPPPTSSTSAQSAVSSRAHLAVPGSVTRQPHDPSARRRPSAGLAETEPEQRARPRPLPAPRSAVPTRLPGVSSCPAVKRAAISCARRPSYRSIAPIS